MPSTPRPMQVGSSSYVPCVIPRAARQRCIMYLMRNVSSYALTKQKRAAVLAVLHAVFSEQNLALVRSLYHPACENACPVSKKETELLRSKNRCARLPEFHVRSSQATHDEQCSRKSQPRTQETKPRSAGAPSRRALIRMLGAILAETDEGWSTRRWFAEDSIVQTEDPKRFHAPAPTYEGSAEELARKIIELVIADNPIGRRELRR